MNRWLFGVKRRWASDVGRCTTWYCATRHFTCTLTRTVTSGLRCAQIRYSCSTRCRPKLQITPRRSTCSGCRLPTWPSILFKPGRLIHCKVCKWKTLTSNVDVGAGPTYYAVIYMALCYIAH